MSVACFRQCVTNWTWCRDDEERAVGDFVARSCKDNRGGEDAASRARHISCGTTKAQARNWQRLQSRSCSTTSKIENRETCLQFRRYLQDKFFDGIDSTMFFYILISYCSGLIMLATVLVEGRDDHLPAVGVAAEACGDSTWL